MGLERHVEGITEPWGVLDVRRGGGGGRHWGETCEWLGQGEKGTSEALEFVGKDTWWGSWGGLGGAAWGLGVLVGAGDREGLGLMGARRG